MPGERDIVKNEWPQHYAGAYFGGTIWYWWSFSHDCTGGRGFEDTIFAHRGPHKHSPRAPALGLGAAPLVAPADEALRRVASSIHVVRV